MSFVLGRALDALRIRGVRGSGIENAYSASQAAGVSPIACPLLPVSMQLRLSALLGAQPLR